MRKVAPEIAARPENHPIQWKESKRAFIAGARRIFVYMTMDVTTLSDEAGEKELTRLDAEMVRWWAQACADKD